MKRALLSLLVLGLLSVACGEPGDGGSGTGGGQGSYFGTWELAEGFGPAGPITVPVDFRITLNLDEHSLNGIAACNAYGTEQFTIAGNTLELEGVGMTQMGCAEDVQEAESAYIEALEAAEQIDRAGDTLTLSGPEVELVFAFVPPPPTEELVGTTWILESMLYGSPETGVAVSAEPAELKLNEDGTITGSSGCRQLNGTWKESGDMIVFPNFGAEGGCSESLEEQDGQVISMGDGFTFEIEGDILTIDPRLGEARLQYRAATPNPGG